MSAFEKQEYIPLILWYQNNSYIFTEIELSNYKDTTIDVSENHFSFTSFSKEKTYKIEFDLYKSIKNHKIQYKENNIKIVFEKEENEEWPRLTQMKNLYKQNIKIHWTYWNTEEDEEENDMMSNFDMEQMMRGMNGNQFNMEEMMKNMSSEEDESDAINNDSDETEDNQDNANENKDENKNALNEDLDAAFDNSHSEEMASCNH
jgi:hypothetical protein